MEETNVENIEQPTPGLKFKMEFKGTNAFVPKNEPWPKWARYLVGIGKGMMAFELTEDGEKYMEEYRKNPDNALKPRTRQEEEKKMGAIGFAS